MPTSRQRLMQLITGNPELIDRLLFVADDQPTRPAITHPESAHRLFAPHLAGHTTERLVVAALDRRRRPMAVETLTTGTEAFTIVDPRQIFSWALRQGRHGASAILMAHNHPSGDPSPSQQDLEVTRRVARAGQVLGIPLLDHIVVGNARHFVSLAQEGHLQPHSHDKVSYTS